MRLSIRLSLILLFLSTGAITLLSNCSPKVVSTKVQELPAVSYSASLHTIIVGKCSPCHVPETAEQDFQKSYTFSQSHIDEIIRRVSLKPSEDDYMPFEGKNPALSTEEISLFKKWKEEGFGK